MDKLVTDVGLALYDYLEKCPDEPDPRNFHRFLNDNLAVDFLAKHFTSKPVTDVLHHLGADATNKEWANVGISALQMFVCYNWLGYKELLSDRLAEVLKASFPDPDSYLEVTDETYQQIKEKELLCLAKYALLSDLDQEDKVTATLIWELRYLTIHQVILEEPSINLYKKIKRNIASLEHFIEVPSELKERLLRTQLSAEIAQVLLWYREVGSSKLCLENALKFSGLNIELTGALGVRTKFQEKATSQLIIEIDRKNEENALITSATRIVCDNPKNVQLDDDTLLNKIKLVAPNERNSGVQLFPQEEAIVLAVACHKRRANASGDELVIEELNTFVEHLLSKSSMWTVRFKVLLLRSLLERNSSRRVERAMMQLDHLVCAARGEEVDDGQNRLALFYAALPDPSWVVEKHLGDILLSLGCTKTALDLFEKLQSWEDMIVCYHKLDRKHHAEQVIRDKLALKETPYLWCLLGKATDDISYYEKSWTDSNEKYYKAKTALGDYFFERKDYKTCVDHYRASLKLNSLQVNAWQRLGFACLDGEDYEGCSKAYRRYLEFEQDAYEAWNNLSKAYIKLDSKERAYRTLMEAIKWNYDEWRLWENFLLVAVDVGSFEEAMRAWHRLIEIKGKHEDDMVIEILVNSVKGDVKDFHGNGSARLAKKLLTLLARIANTNYSSPRLWLAYARLLEHQKEDADRILDMVQKSNRATIQNPSWAKSPESTTEALNHCTATMEVYLACLTRISDQDKKEKTRAIFRLAYNNVVKTVESSLSTWDQKKPNVKDVASALADFNELVSLLQV